MELKCKSATTRFPHNINTPFGSNTPPKIVKPMFLLTRHFMCVDIIPDVRVQDSLMYLFENTSQSVLLGA